MAATRNSQLDGWRAFAVLGVMWLHWTPDSWRGKIPFELGLFYFLTLTGFLITRILLHERTVGEHSGKPWRRGVYLHFQKRRMIRILLPCYAAMVFALLCGARDIRAHPLAYFGHWSNLHMAFLPAWPPGTAHWWTLAVQVQFYLVWPLVVFLVPRRAMAGAFLACAAIGPLSRLVAYRFFPEVHHVEALPTTSMDYFAIGALLALALDRGMKPGDRRLTSAAWISFALYAAIRIARSGFDVHVGIADYLQQTFLSVAFAGLISASLAGFKGVLEKVLDHGAVQHIARLSFGLYLFHTLVPLALGWVAPWLWHPFFQGPFELLRLVVFALASWGMAFLSWRFLETHKAHPSRHAASGHPGR